MDRYRTVPHRAAELAVPLVPVHYLSPRSPWSRLSPRCAASQTPSLCRRAASRCSSPVARTQGTRVCTGRSEPEPTASTAPICSPTRWLHPVTAIDVATASTVMYRRLLYFFTCATCVGRCVYSPIGTVRADAKGCALPKSNKSLSAHHHHHILQHHTARRTQASPPNPKYSTRARRMHRSRQRAPRPRARAPR